MIGRAVVARRPLQEREGDEGERAATTIACEI
jgi:hypothetical protein